MLTYLNFLRKFKSESSQASIEFILLAGGLIVAVLAFFTIKNSISSLANATSQLVEQQRNESIAKLTR